jgi:hypothetical protein
MVHFSMTVRMDTRHDHSTVQPRTGQAGRLAGAVPRESGGTRYFMSNREAWIPASAGIRRAVRGSTVIVDDDHSGTRELADLRSAVDCFELDEEELRVFLHGILHERNH